MAMIRGGVVVSRGRMQTEMARRMVGSGGLAMRTSPAQFLSLGGILKGIGRGIGGAIGGFATGGPVGALAGAAGGLFGGGGTSAPPTGCPAGFVDRGMGCEPVTSIGGGGGGSFGLPGTTRGGLGLPFGPPSDPFALPRGPTGTAVLGAFGVPAMVADIVGTVETRTGERRPIRRCLPGLVLGRDNLCYPKAVLGGRSKWRKHPAPRRPPVTAADAKAIRQAESARGRVKRLALGVGFTCTARGARRRK